MVGGGVCVRGVGHMLERSSGKTSVIIVNFGGVWLAFKFGQLCSAYSTTVEWSC